MGIITIIPNTAENTNNIQTSPQQK